MSPQLVGTLAWVFIFGGILAASLGWFLQAASPMVGGVMLASAAIAVVAGVALIVVRSRMKDSP